MGRWVGISGATKEKEEKSGHPLQKSRHAAVRYVPVLHAVSNILETYCKYHLIVLYIEAEKDQFTVRSLSATI
jgi:hypothetical protein